MSIENENMFDDDLELSFFNFEEDDLPESTENENDNNDENNNEDEPKPEPKKIISKSDTNDSDEINDDKDSDSNEDTDDDNDDPDEDTSDDSGDSDDLTEYDSLMANLIEQGALLLPEDYEYEPTKEGIAKAFEDSEKFRNELAFQEAVKWLISEEGLDFVKVQQLKEDLDSLDNIENLDTDSKLEIIKKSYEKQGMDETEIEELLEEMIYDEKLLESQLKISTRFLKKEKDKELEKVVEEPVNNKKNLEKEQRENQELIKNTLYKEEINGYTLAPKSREKIYKSLYTPVKTDKGDVSTEFSERLKMAMAHPETLVVLADLLLSIDDKGFNFKTLKAVEETKVTKTIKKSIRDLQNSGAKQKASTNKMQTKKDFDLSQARFI